MTTATRTDLKQHWIPVKDCDPRAVALYKRHYSSRKGNVDWLRYGFSGVGESLILLTVDCRALFGWRRQNLRDDGQTGIECFVFRNMGDLLSSKLILQAEVWAFSKWERQRLFSFVDSKKIQSTNPGYCFLQAGWQKCGHSKGGLLILEKLPNGH